MVDSAKEVILVNLEDEMKQSYLDYAMSVIVGRALPDVRDGLKPVHRRVLFAMSELGNDWNKAYKKSARVVGDVIGKYHPHGDSAVYDTIVRMAQPFSLRYMLVDGQGNFGSVDGDSAAAMRYTEVRMSKIAHELLRDIDKETVDFAPNYDESEKEPIVLPTRVPNLLINGSSGIAVGMATNIPPHNLNEVINATVAMIDNPMIEFEELMEHLPGPDFPTAGIINGAQGIRDAYRTGRGKIYVRAKAHFEEDGTGRDIIAVTELPYQVNKARLLEKIAQLVKEKRLEGISGIRDESDKDGMRVVIELKRGEVPEVILNNLFQYTQMQTVFGINMVALLDGQPRTLNLKQILEAFLRHRREVVTRRTIYELAKARARAHVLEGLTVALANIDEIIQTIKASPGPAEAREALMSKAWEPGPVRAMLQRADSVKSRPDDISEDLGLTDKGYLLSQTQAQAILDMRLHRLTGLEQEKLTNEYAEILDTIAGLIKILSEPDELLRVIREELVAVREQFGDDRRTEIMQNYSGLDLEDLITEEDMMVTFSHTGYVKAQPLTDYRAQKRGGRGKSATAIKEEDFVEKFWVANSHDTLLCFSSAGKVYWIKVYQLPQASSASRGRPIVNLLPLNEGERINAVLPVREFADDQFIFFATRSGTVKKTALSAYSRPRANGIIAVDLLDDDTLMAVALTDGSKDVMLFCSSGKCIRFNEQDVREMGRTARGVRGMRMPKGEKLVSMIVVDDGDILTVSENGYGKRTDQTEFNPQGRGGQGVIAMQTSERNGALVGAVQTVEEDQLMLITNGGTLVRTRVEEVSRLSRNTQGVTMIRLTKGEKLIGIARVESLESDEEDVDAEAEDGSEDESV